MIFGIHRYDEEVAQSDLLTQEQRARIGTGGLGGRGVRDNKKGSTATWK